MFTGIIESQGILRDIQATYTNKTFWVESPLSTELKIDQSLAHSGICLTVEDIENNVHRVTAIHETRIKTTIDQWRIGDAVNLERCMQMNGRIDGHIVQGHVDTTGTCIETRQMQGSWEFRIRFPREFAHLVIEKGSICIDGISLTAFNVTTEELTVGIIPYTFHHTNMRNLQTGSPVNLEFDVIGKYVQRWQQVQTH